MRILHVMAGNQHGGAETACVDMAIAMHQRGEHAGQKLEIQVATRPNDVRVARLRAAGITVHELCFGCKLFDLFTKAGLKRIIRDFQPDIIQSWMSRAPSFVPAYSPSVSVRPYKHIGRLGNEYKRKYFKSCDGFVTITPELADYVQGWGIAPEHVRHINNFADVESMEAPIKRNDYGTPEDATVLLGLGRLHDDKAFDVLIKAVAQLPDHVYAWIAGEGPLRGELEQLIRDLGLERRVKLLGWQSDRAALFEQADICTFISRDEPFGTVFVQSWALKTPVIVSDADGPRQFVRDGEDGLLVPRDDVGALADAVQKLDADKVLQDRFIKRGFKRYEAEFTKLASVEAYLDFYRVRLQN